MTTFFPRSTIDLKLEEPAAFRRLSFSLVEMALVTGVVLRLFRLVALTHGASSWWYLVGSFGLGLLVLVGMATAHLANYPVQRWAWRAPAFALLEVAAEMTTSLALIALAREPIGSSRAHWHDWPEMAWRTLLWRSGVVLGWALVLAGAVLLVRRLIVARHHARGARRV
jgi:hypothetical protein